MKRGGIIETASCRERFPCEGFVEIERMASVLRIVPAGEDGEERGGWERTTSVS